MVRPTPRKPKAVHQIGASADQYPQRNQVPGKQFPRVVYSAAKYGHANQGYHRLREGLLQANEQCRVREDDGER